MGTGEWAIRIARGCRPGRRRWTGPSPRRRRTLTAHCILVSSSFLQEPMGEVREEYGSQCHGSIPDDPRVRRTDGRVGPRQHHQSRFDSRGFGPDYTLYEGLDWGSPPDYFFHKGGMVQLTRYAASKLGPRGVRVNTIIAGGLFSEQDPTFVERYNVRTFLGRMANQTDLKGVIVFLASDASAYITGANIHVDGGYTSQ